MRPPVGSRSKVEAYLRSVMPPPDWRSVVNPMTAHRLVADAPGGVLALIELSFDQAGLPESDVVRFCREVVTPYLRTATDLDAAKRARIATLILSKLETKTPLLGDQALASLAWLSPLNVRGEAFGLSRWGALLLQVGEPYLRAHDLRGHRALARLGVAPGHVAEALLTTLRELTCQELRTSEYLLLDGALLSLVRGQAVVAEDRLIERQEACGLPAVSRLAIALRVARGDPWDVLHVQLAELAAQGGLRNVDYVLCLGEALRGEAEGALEDLPGLLRLRPTLRVGELGPLLDASLGFLHTGEQVAEMIETGALVWDAEAMRLQAAE